MMDFEAPQTQLERIRNAEFDNIRSLFKPGLRVLELGGGTGYQASLIAALGCDVTSIDLADRHRPYQLFHPVIDYDGKHIPADTAAFDIVFSSNVLEHVPHVEDLLRETRRVLRPGGTALHIVPSPAWRIWTSLTFFAFAAKVFLGLQRPTPGMVEHTSVASAAERVGWRRLVAHGLLGPFAAHGEFPNAAAEIYYFSARRWRGVFKRSGFRIARYETNGLFYTGYAIVPRLSFRSRRALSRILGASCHTFYLTPED